MRTSGVIGCLTTAAAFLGCAPGALAYGGGLWGGFRPSPSKAVSGAGGNPHDRFRNVAPKEQQSDPPYGEQPSSTETTSVSPISTTSSSEEVTSTSDGKISSTRFGGKHEKDH